MATSAIIGGALTRRLADSGTHRILIAARDEASLAAAIADTPNSSSLVLDAMSFDEVESCLAAGRKLGDGRLDGGMSSIRTAAR